MGEGFMPVHDWTRVDAGIFHHFHLEWVGDLSGALNRGLLPPGFYALGEQFAGGLGPDVLTLQATNVKTGPVEEAPGGIALATAPPKVRYRTRAVPDAYAQKARSIVIRHISDHRVIAMCEIVSPGNKNSRHGLRSFVEKAARILRAGVHLVVLDLFPPGPRDPQGVHKAIWEEFDDDDFALPPDKSLTLVSYLSGPVPEAFIEPISVGAQLPDMPIFLTPDVYVPLPLEVTYQSAWEKMPYYWREVLSAPPTTGSQPDTTEWPHL
jgi:Protein of unknown function (DUF4058)